VTVGVGDAGVFADRCDLLAELGWQTD